MPISKIKTVSIADDAITGAKLENNPTTYSFTLKVEDQYGFESIEDEITIKLAEFSAPIVPELFVVSYSDHVKLSWGFESEDSIDPLTSYADFEGYKLYRSEDGGETCFPIQQIEVNPQAGKTLIWPADWTHIHHANAVTKGNKYIITGWIDFAIE